MKNSLIIDSKKSILCDKSLIGGKASQLAKLSANFESVPTWYVLSTEAFDLFIQENEIEKPLENYLQELTSPTHAHAVSEKINKLFENCFLPEKVEAMIARLINPTSLFAVRSSVIDEDGAQSSFAGMMDSYLYQNGFDAIESSIINCYKSCFSERALSYRLQKKLSVQNIKTAVIIQQMVDAQVAGVAFTANPLNGMRNECLISATFGVGEGVVSGECETDEFTIHHFTNEITENIRQKDLMYVQSEKGAKKVQVPSNNRAKACLTHEQIKMVKDTALKIALQQKSPQDIEWAIDKYGNLKLLQTRPITSLQPPKKSNSENIVFDNSNIQESFCGVTTPLTYSYANEAYFRVYHQMLDVMGMPESEKAKHEKRHRNMISYVRGRVYYNINSWYEGLKLFPKFKESKEDMERMMGLQDPVDFVEDSEKSFSEKLKMIPNMIRCYYALIKSFIKIDKHYSEFMTIFDHEYKYFNRSHFQFLDLSELMELTDRIINRITSRWHAPIINDFYCMTMNGKVFRTIEKAGIKQAAVHVGNLLSGEEGIDSTEPTKQLLKLADEVRSNESLKDLFSRYQDNELHIILKKSHYDYFKKCEAFIESYGDRCIGELKLESISMRQDPTFMYSCIRNYMQQERITYKSFQDNEQKLRSSSEMIVFAEIKKQLGSSKLRAFKKDLTKLRKAVKYRENMRLKRTLVFGLSRDIYLEIGKQLETYGKLNDARDIFYITLSELEELRLGRIAQTNLKDLVQIRRSELESYEDKEPAHHFITNGLVQVGNNFEYPYKKKKSGTLSGIGCYPGVIRERVKKVFDPKDCQNLNGKILCTVRTDPGWAPLFPTISGLIVERGSTLSHSAVIARELGIPTIVGVAGITETLKDNELIEFDGSSGEITLLERDKPRVADTI